MKALIMLLILTVFSLPAFSQKETTHQDLYWLRFSLNYKINPKWSVSYNIEDRNYLGSNRSNHFLNWVTAKHQLSDRWSLGFGYLYFVLSLPQDPDEEFAYNKREHRPYQYITYKRKVFNRGTLSYRFMLEERIRENRHEGVGKADPNLEWRFRNKLKFQYRLITTANPVDLVLSSEIMYHVGEPIEGNYFDQNRATAGLYWTVARRSKLGFAYVHWYQRRGTSTNFYQRDIFALSLSQGIN